MTDYGQPQWATPSAPGASEVPDVATNDFTTGVSSSNQNTGLTAVQARAEKSSMVQVALSVFNILICALMIYLGVAGIMQITFGAGFNELSELFVIIYMFVFSALLLTYEAMWWKSINSINRVLRKNFGFMYGLKGKAGFLVFVAFLCLGLEGITNLEVLMYATGSLWLVAGVLHIFVAFWRPHLVSNYEAPTAGWADDIV